MSVDGWSTPVPGRPRPGMVVTSPHAPVEGGLAWALACGAIMAVPDGRAWNLLIDPQTTMTAARERLREWGIDSPDAFHATIQHLLDESVDGFEHVLDLRHQVWLQEWRTLDFAAWQDLIVRTSQSTGAPAAASAHVEAGASILRYEHAFRADGLLPPDRTVHSMRAYDWVWAINVASWAVMAALCDEDTAHQIVLHAGRLCARHYTSWSDLSAAFSLGRMLAYDNDGFSEECYGDSVATHRALTTAPDSPWLTLPWRGAHRASPAMPPAAGPPPAEETVPGPAPTAKVSELGLLARGLLAPLAVAAIGVAGWLYFRGAFGQSRPVLLGGSAIAAGIFGIVVTRLRRGVSGLVPALSDDTAEPPARMSIISYLAMAIGPPSVMLALLLPNSVGMVAGGAAVAFGLVGRLINRRPNQIGNRFRANVGILTGTVAILVAIAMDAIRTGSG